MNQSTQLQQPALSQVPENPIVDESPDLMQSAKISSGKRNSIIERTTTTATATRECLRENQFVHL